MLCMYWYFKNIGYKFESNACNTCHEVLMTVYELKNIAILNQKDVDYRCILWGISRNETVNPIQDGLFWGCSRLGGGGGVKRGPP